MACFRVSSWAVLLSAWRFEEREFSLDADSDVTTDCCEGTDDFDLCKSCRDAGSSCACEDKTMLTMQKCVAGDVLESESGDAARRLTAIDEIRCRACAKTVSQGRYYCECLFCLEAVGLANIPTRL